MRGSVLTNPVFMSWAGLAVLLLLLGLVLVWAAGLLYVRSRNHGRSEFRRLFQKKWRFRLGLFLTAVVFAILFTAAYYTRASSRAAVIITLNYAEASWGENANGTRYNMSEILCDEVLERAIAKGAFENVTASELRECLTVEPLVQGNPYDEQGYHIATEFVVTYKADRTTAHLDAQNVVWLIAGAYKEFYVDQYADNFSVLKWDEEDDAAIADMEYLDAVEYLQKQAYRVENYMYALGEKNASFVSSEGDTFYSLASKVQKLSQMQIQGRLQSYLLHNGIAKDAESYIGRLEYDNRLTDYDMQRASASFEVRNDAVEMYAEEMTRVVLVPTWGEDGTYYMGRTKVGVDDLSIEAEQYSQQAAGYLKEIESNRSVISAIDGASGSGEDATAEQLIREISATLKSYAEAAKAAGQEYSENLMNKCISASVTGVSLPRLMMVCFGVAVAFYLAVNLLAVAVKLPKGSGEGMDFPEEPDGSGEHRKRERTGAAV